MSKNITMEELEKQLYEELEKLNITDYTVHEHKALFHSDERDEAGAVLEGTTVKNLFLRRRKTDQYYLVVTDIFTHVVLKNLKKKVGWGNVRFSTPEELVEVLGVTPGSVTPLALLHDVNHQVTVVLTKEILRVGDDELINAHPCRNTASLSMRKSDFMKFLEYTGNEIFYEPEDSIETE